MAASFGDLANSLIEGGLTPQAARIIANALANAASPTFSRGGDTTDATPVEKLRLITPDTRRYELTNLDYSPDDPFQERLSSNATAYDPGLVDHPYKDSQPVVTAPPLSSPRVQGGNYVDVSNSVEGSAAISKVDLKLRREQGRHLRIDPGTKSLEAVDFSASTESPRVLAAEFREGESGTELVISLRNLEEVELLLSNADRRKALVFPQAAASGPGPAGMGAGVARTLESVTVTLSTGQTQPVLAWTNGAASAAPDWWTAASGAAGVLRAYAVFDATKNTSGVADTNSGDKQLIRSVGITSINKQASGVFRVKLATALPTKNYVVLGVGNKTNTNLQSTLVFDDGFAFDEDDFQVRFIDAGNGTENPTRGTIAVFY